MFGEIAQKLRTSIFRKSGAEAAPGIVPRPSTTADSADFLREDATWAIPPYEPSVCQARLTLTSGDPFNATGTTTGGTIYWTPCRGNKVWLYSSTLSRWVQFSLTEKSVAAPGGALSAYDIFAYNNAGTPALETLAWSSWTARSTALTTQDGIYVKSGDPTRRYIGTCWSDTGIVPSHKAARGLWNYYNRAPSSLATAESGTWTYGLGTWRIANNNNANALYFVVGIQEDYYKITTVSFGALTDSGYFSSSIGYDSTTPIGQAGGRVGGIAGGIQANSVQNAVHQPGIGIHYYAWLEEVDKVSADVTFYSGDARFQSGLVAQIYC